ncbi:MAG: TIGR02391 family protein [Bifidobacteriaceae bacterium]|nr:TIGR02391 family protein [Bifidobacteriaceae bacterium]
MTGRLEQMIALARMADTDPCSLKEMHPAVWQAAATPWSDERWLEAVIAATQAVLDRVSDRLGWEPDQFNSGSPWEQVFADDSQDAHTTRHLGLPPGVDQTSGHNLVAALRHVAVGLPVLVIDPNLAPHKGLTRQDALERLAALSLLAWWLDHCPIVPAP